MKQNQKCLLALVAVAIAISILFLSRRQHRVSSEAADQKEIETINAASEVAKPAPQSPPNVPSPDASPDPVERRNEKKRELDSEIYLWQSSIVYFGKVVDENGSPISKVQISFGANSLNESKAEVYNVETAATDEGGMFKIDGIRGIGLTIQLSHPNYYPFPENSLGFDKRSLPKSGYFPDSEEKAEVFRMHSKGHPVPLVFYTGGFHKQNDGSIAIFPLRGQTRSEIVGNLQIQGWRNLRSTENPFDWKIRLALPEGGLLEKTNYFDFVAPKSGYLKAVDVEVSGSESIRKEYFLKLPGGFVRFKLHVIMGKDMFVVGEYYFNPDGSTNLESDR